MTSEVPLRCKCGRVRGVVSDVSPRTVNRVVCYCKDCQAFARFVGQDGVMDASGGTDIVQMNPARLSIREGAELVRCVRLSETGMFRFFTDCCKTPMGNAVNGKLPFIGLIHSILDVDSAGRSLDELVGKPIGAIFGKCATGPVPSGTHDGGSFRVIARCSRLMIGWMIRPRGASPFFDSHTKQPKRAPLVLRKDERDALRV